jgi:hypothetical protein
MPIWSWLDGPFNFFQIKEVNKNSRFEEEIRNEKEEKRREEEERKERLQAFRDRAKLFEGGKG